MDGDLDADKGAVENEICQSSQPLLATERSILAHLSLLSRMPLDQIRWLVEEGGRGGAGTGSEAPSYVLRLCKCEWPLSLSPFYGNRD